MSSPSSSAASTSSETGELKINFQPCDMTTPDGYLKDCGEIYANRGNGHSYGWTCDLTTDSRNRDSLGTVESSQMIPDRYNSLNGGVCDDDSWKIAVTNGKYVVTVLYSDIHHDSNTETCEVNGISSSVAGDIVPMNTPMSVTLDVTVTDGFIQLDGEYDRPTNPSCSSYAAITIVAAAEEQTFLFSLLSEPAEVAMYGFALVGLVSIVSTFYNFSRSKYQEIPEDTEV